jgi:hypothetical protein
MRSLPVGIGPREKRSPSKAFMLYKSVILGATGASCAIVKAAQAARDVRRLRKYMFGRRKWWLRLLLVGTLGSL